MKRYWLFGGSDFYPDGGMKDFKGSYDRLEDAIAAKPAVDSDRWHHVFDSEKGSIVSRDESAYGSEDCEYPVSVECEADEID